MQLCFAVAVTIQVQDLPSQLLGRSFSCLQGSGASDSLLTSESLSPEESKSGRRTETESAEQLLREPKAHGRSGAQRQSMCSTWARLGPHHQYWVQDSNHWLQLVTVLCVSVGHSAGRKGNQDCQGARQTCLPESRNMEKCH